MFGRTLAITCQAPVAGVSGAVIDGVCPTRAASRGAALFVSSEAVLAVHRRAAPPLPERPEAGPGRPDQGLGDGRVPPYRDYGGREGRDAPLRSGPKQPLGV